MKNDNVLVFENDFKIVAKGNNILIFFNKNTKIGNYKKCISISKSYLLKIIATSLKKKFNDEKRAA